ncbi:MAG: hypothetical protein JKY37_14170 [Nannocystaceae bacterium]|nr:hypothetical protein [Nannocystaceae bacterium]
MTVSRHETCTSPAGRPLSKRGSHPSGMGVSAPVEVAVLSPVTSVEAEPAEAEDSSAPELLPPFVADVATVGPQATSSAATKLVGTHLTIDGPTSPHTMCRAEFTDAHTKPPLTARESSTARLPI